MTKGARRRQRLSSETRLRERKTTLFVAFYLFSPSVTATPCHLPHQREAQNVQFAFSKTALFDFLVLFQMLECHCEEFESLRHGYAVPPPFRAREANPKQSVLSCKRIATGTASLALKGGGPR